ncbi:MAG: 4Fe-4S dicluster domain-containing protein [Deltaproteobacteria bacterium]|nr:4Fe-4S dicluster domain-containing protein [Deltaproteobacteria bacterium]
MIRRPFFGCGKPKLDYAGIDGLDQVDIKDIPVSERVVLFVEAPPSAISDVSFQVGDKIKTGQNLRVSPFSKATFTSTVTGVISNVAKKKGYLGKPLLSVSIDVSEADEVDEDFARAVQAAEPEETGRYLSELPGGANLNALIHPRTPLKTIVVNGMDKDLLVTTQQMVVKSKADDLKDGIEYLKKITGNPKVVLVVPPYLGTEASKSGADVRTITPSYPNSLPEMIMKDMLEQVVPAGMDSMSLGVGFISAEGVASLKSAVIEGKPPVTKMLTVIGKDEKTQVVRVRVGTPIHSVLSALQIPMEQGDRLVIGGPMTGRSIYTEETPILQDTDAIMVQGRDQILLNGNDPCINCGECVRACPVRIPVNMLVRLLENSQYENAASEYDLLSCIECGLCSYVCEAKIPVFHYIMLGKYELSLMRRAEESANG